VRKKYARKQTEGEKKYDFQCVKVGRQEGKETGKMTKCNGQKKKEETGEKQLGRWPQETGRKGDRSYE
jgi:hypothetical protein